MYRNLWSPPSQSSSHLVSIRYYFYRRGYTNTKSLSKLLMSQYSMISLFSYKFSIQIQICFQTLKLWCLKNTNLDKEQNRECHCSSCQTHLWVGRPAPSMAASLLPPPSRASSASFEAACWAENPPGQDVRMLCAAFLPLSGHVLAVPPAVYWRVTGGSSSLLSMHPLSTCLPALLTSLFPHVCFLPSLPK